MKIKKLLVTILMLTVILSVLGATSVSAQEPLTITTDDEFLSAVASGGSYKLGADIVLDMAVRCVVDAVIDFAGYTVSTTEQINSADLLSVSDGATLTFTDSSTEGYGKLITSYEGDSVFWMAGGNLVIENISIVSTRQLQHAQIYVSDNATVTLRGAQLEKVFIYSGYMIIEDGTTVNEWIIEGGVFNVDPSGFNGFNPLYEAVKSEGEELWTIQNHTCRSDDGDHICDICNGYMSELCVDSDGNHICDVVTCERHANWMCEGYTVWDGFSWDTVDHWVICSVCGGEMWESHVDEDTDLLCDICAYNMSDECSHDNWEYSYVLIGHQRMCLDCGQVLSQRKHVLDYTPTENGHMPVCYDGECTYVFEEESHVETESDPDHVCDLCNEATDLWCTPTSDSNHECANQYCNNLTCSDADGDHVCDGEQCGQVMDWLCEDSEDADHKCDVCGALLYRVICFDYDGDYVCDGCGEDIPCEHYLHSVMDNGDGTHSGECDYCGRTVTEECTKYYYNWDGDGHFATCYCEHSFPTEAHTYEENRIESHSMLDHGIVCDNDDCSYVIYVSHTDENTDGMCDVCNYEIVEIHDVYIGDIALGNGKYLDTLGNVSDQKPEGGYAYYANGVLELNNFVYEGEGMLYREYTDGYKWFIGIYASKDVTIVLKGENSLNVSENYNCDGILAEGNLTLSGDGSLEILGGHDGIFVVDGELTVGDNLEVTIEAGDDGIYVSSGNMTLDGDAKLSILANDDGIDLNIGSLTVNSGEIYIESNDHGFDVDGSVTVKDGMIEITAGDDGFNVENDILIDGGEIIIEAEDYGFDSDDGNITINGGMIDIKVHEGDGINAYGDITVTGGEIIIDAYDSGMLTYEGKLTVSGGVIDITNTEGYGIVAFEADINGGDIYIDTQVPTIYIYTGYIIAGKFNFNPSEYTPYYSSTEYDSETGIWTVTKSISVEEAEERIEELEAGIVAVSEALENGDDALDEKITALGEALATAKSNLENADKELKAGLETKIEEAKETLDNVIKAVQKNLDDAKTALGKAIEDGDKALDTKIADLNTALASAKTALETADAQNKTALEGKISDAQTALKTAVDKVAKDLVDARLALDAKDAELEQKTDKLTIIIIIVSVVSGIALCGSGALTVVFLVDRKKRIK